MFTRRAAGIKSLVMVLMVVFGVFGCSKKSDQTSPRSGETGRLTVYTVNYPLKYFADRIVGEAADVVFPAPRDEDPAFWKPDAATVEAYQKADLILLNGATYAKWIAMVSMPTSKMVDTSAGFAGNYIGLNDAVTHSHGPEGKHAHGNIAFTTWLDFAQAAEQARSVKDAFAKLEPQQRAAFEANFRTLERELLDLDAQMLNVASKIGAEPLLVSHPVYQYWTRRYGLNVKSVHWEPDSFPGEGMWRELVKLRQEYQSSWMIWEDEPLPMISDQLKKIGTQSVVFNPCGNRPDEGDFMTVMKSNIENVRLILTNNG
ncbi:MAG: metal ABC transporter substrate-binding protein [Planctomycetota bacterium]|jgi:zinc transport system substrate-binding protein